VDRNQPQETACCGESQAEVTNMSFLEENSVAGQGSTGNVIAALSSFFIPGLGQLIQGRPFIALIQFVLAGILWLVWLGWIIHLWSILDAALFEPRGT
jgi:TM2 domain-containing membrane protein YozV